MSFEDIVTGYSAGLPSQNTSDELAEGVFQIITSVSKYKILLNRFLNWQQRDNHLVCERLHGEISQLDEKISKQIKKTVSLLKKVNETDHLTSSRTIKKIRGVKLVKDFQSVLVEFETAKKRFQSLVVQSRQRNYAPVPPLPSSLSQMNSRRGDSDEETSFVCQSQQLVVEANESEVMLNAVVNEERDQAIQEIHQQVREVSEIFKDLTQIVANQRHIIDDSEANIESAASTTVQANVQLTRAAERKSSNYWKWLALAIVGTAVLILIFA